MSDRPVLRLTDSHRLDLLAAAVLDYLDDTFTEGQLDDDSNPPHTALYNLAAAMEERRSNGGDEHADREADLVLEYGIGTGEGRVQGLATGWNR